MKNSNRLFTLLTLSGLFALLATDLFVTARTAKAPASSAQPPNKIAPWVLENTRAGREAEFFVLLAAQADLSAAAAMPGKVEQTRYVHDRLRDTAQRSQAPLLDWLRAKGVAYQSFFLVNAVLVTGTRELAEALAARPDIAGIEGNPAIRQREPVTLDADELRALAQRATAPQAVETGITAIRAPEVWATGVKGAGIVIGVADSGVKWDHNALRNHYRGWNGSSVSHTFNWHDAILTGSVGCPNNSPEPCDDQDHGTHVTGTAVGDDGGSNQIGVAPDAKFIACRCMSQLVGTASSYIECLQWFLMPDGAANQAPDIVLTGWTCPLSEGCAATALSSAVTALQSTGIMVVASAGSHGPDCSSVFDPPAILPEAYTVGAVAVDPANLNNITLAAFSGRGPVTVDGSNRLKPEILAPGVLVRSAVRSLGAPYNVFSGTSMSAAHVAGAVALLWAARPALKRQLTRTINVLNDAAVDMPSAECGASATVPNNATGYGRLDIKRAVDLAAATIAPASQNFTPSGGVGSVTVTVGAGVGWAVFNTSAWITVTGGGSGNGTVNYSLAANTGTQVRVGTLIIAGHVFTVTQAAACPFTLNPVSQLVPASGNSYAVTVTTNSGCGWTATSNMPWLTITSSASGTGSGTVSYAVAANPGVRRGGLLTIGGQFFRVTQTPQPALAAGKKGDFDGDRKADFAVWRGPDFPALWLVLQSSNGGALQSIGWGTGQAPYFDVPVPGDYDGDKKIDHAIWRGQDSLWYIRLSSSPTPAFVQLWGANYSPYFDVPTPGDFDGDGKTDIAVWRPSEGNWYVRRSSDNNTQLLTLGQPGDQPVAADYDGDGKTDFAVWRANNGLGNPNWLILNSFDNTLTSVEWGSGQAPYNDVPVPGDYDGDGLTDLAIWRGADTYWYIRKSSDGQSIVQYWGANYAPYFDIPVPADYDGDGKSDIAVWRRAEGAWYVKTSLSNFGAYIVPIPVLGQQGDVPVPAVGVR